MEHEIVLEKTQEGDDYPQDQARNGSSAFTARKERRISLFLSTSSFVFLF